MPDIYTDFAENLSFKIRNIFKIVFSSCDFLFVLFLKNIFKEQIFIAV